MRAKAVKVRNHRQRAKSARFEARIPLAQKQVLERAASLRGTTLTDFVLGSAQEAAAKAIQDFEMLVLRDEARKVFVNALLNPPEPNKSLQAAADRYRKDFA